MKKLSLLFCVSILLASCQGSRSPIYTPLKVQDTIPLSGKIICDSIVTGVVGDQIMVGDYVILGYHRNNQWGHIYDRNGKLLQDFCSQGKGPGEAIFVNSITKGDNPDEIVLFDPEQQKIITYSLDSILSGNKACISESRLPVLPMFVEKVQSAATGLLAIGQNGTISQKTPERFMLLKNGRITSRYGSYPFCEDSLLMKGAYGQRHISLSPDGTKMACGLYFGAILETFDLSDSISLRNINYFNKPEFTYDKVGNITSYDAITFGFGDVCAAEDAIYTAFNGTRDYKRMNNIAVFDWNGTLQKFYKTDYHLIRMCHDSASNLIFATIQADDGEYQLVQFKP